MWELTQTVLLSALLFAAINLATIRILVQSVSMQPTLYESDRVLVNKLAYIVGSPSRKDIIVFNPPVPTWTSLISNASSAYPATLYGSQTVKYPKMTFRFKKHTLPRRPIILVPGACHQGMSLYWVITGITPPTLISGESWRLIPSSAKQSSSSGRSHT